MTQSSHNVKIDDHARARTNAKNLTAARKNFSFSAARARSHAWQLAVPRNHRAAPSLLPIGGEVVMPTFTTIVAAIDFSETSLAAARIAAEMAREAHGGVHLLHVVPNVFEAPWIVHSPAVAFTDLQRTMVDDAKQRLSTLAATEPFRSANAAYEVASGSAADAIVRYAVDHAADLIVMGTHGYGPVTRFLIGHVADRVVRYARCAVLTLPPEALRRPDADTLSGEMATAGASTSRIDPASGSGDEQC